jgi:hypothetical protein
LAADAGGRVSLVEIKEYPYNTVTPGLQLGGYVK